MSLIFLILGMFSDNFIIFRYIPVLLFMSLLIYLFVCLLTEKKCHLKQIVSCWNQTSLKKHLYYIQTSLLNSNQCMLMERLHCGINETKQTWVVTTSFRSSQWLSQLITVNLQHNGIKITLQCSSMSMSTAWKFFPSRVGLACTSSDY